MTIETTDDLTRGFPPHVLREYALLADGYRGAVCGPRGEIVWMCAPEWHDDAIFSTLLGGAGLYAITPVETFVWGGHYEDRSLIWRNRWVTTSTVLECREALAYPGETHRAVLLRRIEAAERQVRVRIELDVRAGFGEERMRDHRRDDHGRWTARSGGLRIRWMGAPDAVLAEDGSLRTELVLDGGTYHDLVLEIGTEQLDEPPRPEEAWAVTETTWRGQVPDFTGTLASRDVRHAHAVLRGLTHPHGGMVAAATMSMPERAEQGRNYDYRYAWIRDQCYAGIGLARHGSDAMLAETVEFMTARLLQDRDSLRPAYTVDGDTVPEEQVLALTGYPGGQRVARGNWVTRQFQLDAFGELLQLFAVAADRGVLDHEGWQAARLATDAITKHWNRPEAGLWELHDDWWTHSRLACVAGLRAAAGHSPTAKDRGAMLSLADTILAETSRRCLSPSGAWLRSPRHQEPDAALLLPIVRGALPALDPRGSATLQSVRRELVVDGYVYRFPQTPHLLGTQEGAFLLCGFVMAMADWQYGNHGAALRTFERNRAAYGPPGLFSEEYDVTQRQLRGNVPQAFVHAALLECVAVMDDRDGFAG